MTEPQAIEPIRPMSMQEQCQFAIDVLGLDVTAEQLYHADARGELWTPILSYWYARRFASPYPRVDRPSEAEPAPGDISWVDGEMYSYIGSGRWRHHS